MKIVVDTNIIFSALLRDDNRFLQHLLMSEYEFYSMRFVMVELFRHKERIVRSSRLPEAEMLDFLHRILKRIEFVNEDLISIRSYALAHRYCGEVDIKDLPFVALALDLDALLWTSDQTLISGAASRGFHKFHKLF